MPTDTLAYRYAHAATESMTGYFSCDPPETLTFAEALARLEAAPLDEFLHRHLLRRIAALPPAEASALADPARPALMALLRETGFLNAAHRRLFEGATEDELRELEAFSPLPYLRFAQRSLSGEGRREQEHIAAWNALFKANLAEGHPLPHPDDADIPLPAFAREAESMKRGIPAAEAYARLAVPGRAVWTRPPARQTAAEALSTLATCGVIAGTELRHESSLAPVGLLRSWNVDVAVRCGGLDYTLQGEATTWGRGLSIADARASYAMEMVERASAYLSIDGDRVTDRAQPAPLVRAAHAELLARGAKALDPRALPIDAEYREQPLYWMEGRDTAGETVLVPVQAVGLFCNLDEPALFLSPGSTGLAAGNTLEEAKVAAVAEVLERDAEATVPWRRGQCFELDAEDGGHPLALLLADYARHGIRVWFRDMTTEFGIPCFQSFVTREDGSFARGAGAGLSGAGALLSALTETPYPYPHGPASAPAPAGLPRRRLEDLPDYRLDSPDRNLLLLETVLTSYGHPPVYVTLTREDLELPVVRALVPGLELTADFDAFSRPAARLFRRCLNR